MLSSKAPNSLFFHLLLILACLAQPAWSETVLVTGEPAGVPFLRDVLEAKGWTDLPTRPLRPGRSWKNRQGDQVVNVSWTPPAAAVAALSDHPETITRPGLLFSGGLTRMRPVRFQFYHLGKLTNPESLTRLTMTNSGAKKAIIHLAEYSGTPSTNYFSTGHDNNVRWLQQSQSLEGVFVEIPPNSSETIFRHELPLEKVISGTLMLSQVEGPPLSFTFEAANSPQSEPALNNLLKASDTHSRGFYPVAKHRISRRYVIGDPELRMNVGAIRQATFSGVRELKGDYGVLWELDLKLENPSDQEKTVQINFMPRGGAATATLLLNQELIEIPRTPVREQKLVRSIKMPPRSQQDILIHTIPEGASSYPVRFIVRCD